MHNMGLSSQFQNVMPGCAPLNYRHLESLWSNHHIDKDDLHHGLLLSDALNGLLF